MKALGLLCSLLLSGCLFITGALNAPRCGDRILDSGEECDDGNNEDGDGCDASCQSEIPPICGDGVLDAGEECDDGNIVDGDGCDAACTIENADPDCGNGVVEAGEDCDDGNIEDGDGCDANCQSEISLNCGDGALDGGEECDDGNGDNNDSCKGDCTNNVCGDSFLFTGIEECDDANLDNGDGCDQNCTLTGCGNGIVTAPEGCDDANTNPNDDCVNTCQIATCGDGFIRFGVEFCDDGNIVDGDGCDANCALEGSPGCDDGVIEAGQECFSDPPQILSVSPNSFPITVKAADFDGDGDIDFVVGFQNDSAPINQVAVFLNDGSATFSQTSFSTGSNPNPSIADMNNDGNPDIVTANLASNDVSVLLGNGSGSFDLPLTSLSGGIKTRAVALGLFDGDLFPDFAIANLGNGTDGNCQTLFNNGAGALGNLVQTPCTNSRPHGVTVAKLNNDNIADLVFAFLDNVGGGGRRLELSLGNGAGLFLAPVTITSQLEASDVKAADLNGDGELDLIASGQNTTTGGFEVFLNEGNGAFGSSTVVDVGGRVPFFRVADLNADGLLDLVGPNITGNNLHIQRGNGNGGFTPGPILTVGLNPTDVEVADFNDDGANDLLVANLNEDTLSLFLANP